MREVGVVGGLEEDSHCLPWSIRCNHHEQKIAAHYLVMTEAATD
jgi:hypothetical protein